MAVGLEDTVAAPLGSTPPEHPTGEPAALPVPSAPDATLSERGGAPSPSATPRLGAGKQLGHFRIERLLGAGGMGEVYLATDLALDRPVAIKVLPAELAGRSDRRERLVREARAQARVSHPHVAHIYFIGEDSGQLYFAMEYIDGVTVAERVAKGPLPVEDAIAIIRAAITGLREANKYGVTHRDVKPSNLMIDGNGIVKVLDFGLAAQREATEEDTGGGVAQTSVAGTPLYMAPEQAFGERVDLRADIYALGATLYHLVSGKPPFDGENADALRTKHATAIRPALVRHGGQARATMTAVEALCARMMAPEPADRFASYDDLLHALELVSTETTRPAGMIVRTMASLLDLLAALLLIGVGALLLEVLDIDANVVPGLVLLAAHGLLAWALTARYGRTLGQALFEIEVVDVATFTRPSPLKAAIRVALPLGILLGTSVVEQVFGLNETLWEIAVVLVMLVVPLALLYASLRVPGKRAFWDRASGTMVRYAIKRTRLGRGVPAQSA